jgi:acetyl-CoA hydrolase
LPTTHDNAVHRQLPNLIGINSALEVDLTGQMNAEVADGRHLGLVGGHGDFMRGCLRSPGGHGIVALESTARGGKVSRIVPRLSNGVVTTARADADVVAAVDAGLVSAPYSSALAASLFVSFQSST